MEQKKHLSFDELVALLPSLGWQTSNSGAVKDRSLEELVKAAHERHQKGEVPDAIVRAENEILLDLPELQKLWIHLGLPF